MKSQRRVLIAAILIAAMVAGAFLLNFALAQSAVRQSNQTWCSVLTELTSKHPSTRDNRQARIFYDNLITIRTRFGC